MFELGSKSGLSFEWPLYFLSMQSSRHEGANKHGEVGKRLGYLFPRGEAAADDGLLR